jgi:chromatin assembly factor 1 subunit B
VYYAPRKPTTETVHITIDTSSTDVVSALPESIVSPRSPSHSVMEPPPSPRPRQLDDGAGEPSMAFVLPYRMIYAVATEDSVLLYDTQQQTPICIVSNLHCATFTDLTW